MALADDIRGLRDRTLAELAAAHDYYVDTSVAWELVKKVIDGGYKVARTNPATGNLTTETDLAARAETYVQRHLCEATFQQFISIFESFFFDLLRLWLTAYPRSLGKKAVDFKTILDDADKDTITQVVVAKELNDVLYERPSAWFEYLESKLEGKAKLGCPTADEIGRLAEAKATRDVLVHSRGIANAVYVAKAGPHARHQPGERVEITERYHRQTWDVISKIVADTSDAAASKAP